MSFAGGSETFASANISSPEKEQVASTIAEQSHDNNSDELLTHRFLQAVTIESFDSTVGITDSDNYAKQSHR